MLPAFADHTLNERRCDMWSHILDRCVREIQVGGPGTKRYQLALLALRRRLLGMLYSVRRNNLEQQIAVLRTEVVELRAQQQRSYSYAVANRIQSKLWTWRALAEELEDLVFKF